MGIQHSFPPFLLRLIEQAIAQALRYDPKARAGMAAMAGRVIAVDLLGLGLAFYAIPDDRGVRLLNEYAGDVQVRIRGTPLALMAMAAGRDRRQTFTGEVEFIGDLGLGQHIQSVLASLDVEWEELLSTYIGDIAAHKLGNLCRSLIGWFGQTRHILEMDAGEYLRTEARFLAEPYDVKGFLTAVDTLRGDADRLAVRLTRLQRQVPNAR